jgi:hypothetical protein
MERLNSTDKTIIHAMLIFGVMLLFTKLTIGSLILGTLAILFYNKAKGV